MKIKPATYDLKLSEKEMKELSNLLEYAMGYLETDVEKVSERKIRICEHFLDTINKRVAWFEGD